MSPHLAIASVLLACTLTPAPDASSGEFRAELKPMNHGSGSGRVTVVLHGSKAIITETVTGLAGKGASHRHPQQLHVNGRGQCPTTNAADANNDGVVSDAEGVPGYGKVGARLSAPRGKRFSYARTITLDPDVAASVRSGKGVVVIVGPVRRRAGGMMQAPVLCGTLLAVTGPGTAPGGPGAPVSPPPVR
jgi:hypothetical protein